MTREDLLVIGRIARPHGLTGEVVIRETPLDANEFRKLQQVTLDLPGRGLRSGLRVSSVRDFKDALLVCFAGTDNVDKANKIRGASVLVAREAMPAISSDEVYYFELVGLIVVDESGNILGKVTKVLPTAGHEVLEVETEDEPILLPYHPEVVLGWERDARRLTVRLPAGLREIYRAKDTKEKS